jgi:hypothetical protein
MEYALKSAFWSNYVQAQERYWSQSPDDFNHPSPNYFKPYRKAAETSIEEFPENARKKFHSAGEHFYQGDVANSIELAFQALEICSFTLGSSHPSASVIMHFIASICETHGLKVEALKMRRTALEIFSDDLLCYSEEYAYYQ